MDLMSFDVRAHLILSTTPSSRQGHDAVSGTALFIGFAIQPLPRRQGSRPP